MMKTRTKLEVKSQRPKRYIKSDAEEVSAKVSPASSWDRVRTYRCGRRGRRAALWDGSSGANASRLASVARLGFPLQGLGKRVTSRGLCVP